MKKIILSLTLLLIVFATGCEKVDEKGAYKEGTYFGSINYESYGKSYVTTATVYVDNTGYIKSVFIDSTYFKDDVYTTKKTLGDEYGMKSASAAAGNIENGAEWYEQISEIEEKVVSEQGLDWVKWSNEEETKLDVNTISGVTITADTYVKAVDAALSQAK